MIFDIALADAQRLIERFQSTAGTITVVIVANIKETLDYEEEYPEAALATEYFSEYEIRHIVNVFQEVGAYVKIYTSEDSFMRSVLDGEFDKLPRKNRLVYNSAQSGTGPGRKSLIPAFCQLHGIPVCNSNPYVTGLARHKYHVASLLTAHGLPACPSWYYLGNRRWMLGRTPPEDVLLIAKAAYESASIGLTDDNVGRLSPVFLATLDHKIRILRQPVIVQRFIEGFEVEVPVFEHAGAQPLGVVSITLDGQKDLGRRFLDFDVVNRDGYGFSASDHLETDLRTRLARDAASVFDLLEVSGVGRVDFRVTPDGAHYVTDVATSPHLVQHSSFAWLFRSAGLPDSHALALLAAVNARRYGWI